jgi:hypothetical protein
MNISSLLGVLGSEPPNAQARKIHSAFFLAQASHINISYSFVLDRGYVHSDELDQDLVVLYRAGFAESQEGREAAEEARAHYAPYSRVIHFLLSEDEVVLDAAATSRFFEIKGLGDPSSRLNWFNSLPSAIRDRASSLSIKVAEMSAA